LQVGKLFRSYLFEQTLPQLPKSFRPHPLSDSLTQ
jgi:hypothetical protein